VGASHHPAKFGYKIVRDLHNAGYIVYPINPKAKVVRQVQKLGLPRVWMQPGSESEDAVRFCEENGIAVVHDACTMINKRTWGNE